MILVVRVAAEPDFRFLVTSEYGEIDEENGSKWHEERNGSRRGLQKVLKSQPENWQAVVQAFGRIKKLLVVNCCIFSGAEVKAGEPLKVTPGDDTVLHLSQPVVYHVYATSLLFTMYVQLVCVNISVQQFDLVFDTDFELSHNWKSGSVYFYGYKASNPYEDEYPSNFFSVISTEIPEGESDNSESEEDIPLTVANNGKPEPKAKKEKPVEIEKAKASKGKEADVGKQTVKTVQPNNEDAESSDDVVFEDDDDDSVDEGDSDDFEEEASESDEETPKKAETSKKRAPESSIKTPVQDKKAKITPQRTDGKKVSGHVATTYPTKKGLLVLTMLWIPTQNPSIQATSNVDCVAQFLGFQFRRSTFRFVTALGVVGNAVVPGAILEYQKLCSEIFLCFYEFRRVM
ncbi:hypothetical protein ACS0TY_020744 [Phlomoides rotata]